MAQPVELESASVAGALLEPSITTMDEGFVGSGLIGSVTEVIIDLNRSAASFVKPSFDVASWQPVTLTLLPETAVHAGVPPAVLGEREKRLSEDPPVGQSDCESPCASNPRLASAWKLLPVSI